MVRSDIEGEKHVIISMWETKEDLLASQSPEDILPDIERLGEMMMFAMFFYEWMVRA